MCFEGYVEQVLLSPQCSAFFFPVLSPRSGSATKHVSCGLSLLFCLPLGLCWSQHQTHRVGGQQPPVSALRIQKLSNSHNERPVVGLDVIMPAVLFMPFFIFITPSSLLLSYSLRSSGLQTLVFSFLIRRHKALKPTLPSPCHWWKEVAFKSFLETKVHFQHMVWSGVRRVVEGVQTIFQKKPQPHPTVQKRYHS